MFCFICHPPHHCCCWGTRELHPKFTECKVNALTQWFSTFFLSSFPAGRRFNLFLFTTSFLVEIFFRCRYYLKAQFSNLHSMHFLLQIHRSLTNSYKNAQEHVWFWQQSFSFLWPAFSLPNSSLELISYLEKIIPPSESKVPAVEKWEPLLKLYTAVPVKIGASLR